MIINTEKELIKYCRDHILFEYNIDSNEYTNHRVKLWTIDDKWRISVRHSKKPSILVMFNTQNGLFIDSLLNQESLEIVDGNILKIGNSLAIYLGELK